MNLLLAIACSPYQPSDQPSDAPRGENTVGSEGGTISMGDVELDIPPGALDEPVEIVITDLGTQPPEPYEGLSTVWSFEPEGLTFDEPVTVRIPYDEHPLPQLYWSEGEGYVQLEDVVFEDGMASASIEHFSTAFVAITPVEIHEQPYEPAPADFLFVVDNSCSMFEFQQQLSTEGPLIFDALTTAGLDYHIGVVNTDMNDPANGSGKLRAIGGNRFIEPTTPDPEQVFALMANMGTTGWYDEKGRAAAWTTIEVNADIPRNEGFFREHATMDFIFLSDEEDQSGGNPVSRQEFIAWMDNLKPWPEMTRAHAIAQRVGQLCNPAGSAGTEYQRYVDQTDGLFIDLCGQDWASGIQQVVADRQTGGIVELPVEPSEIVSVRLDGASALDLEPADYTLDGRRILFDQGVMPVVGEPVVVHYRP